MRQLVWSKVQLRLTGLFRPLQADSFEDGAGSRKTILYRKARIRAGLQYFGVWPGLSLGSRKEDWIVCVRLQGLQRQVRGYVTE